MMLKHGLKIGLGLLALGFLVALIVYNYTKLPPLPDYPRRIATMNNHRITLLETRTPQENALGLGAVPQLPRDYGMLFSGKGSMPIWMKGMRYPIDIIWLNTDNQIIHIVPDAQPSSYPETTFTNSVGTDARWVIELNAGLADQIGLKLGDQVELKN